MTSLLPTISMSELQRCAKERLEEITDYAVIQRHGKDVAFVLHPDLGKVLLDSGLLDVLKTKLAQSKATNTDLQNDSKASVSAAHNPLPELDRILGKVLQELSKR